MTYSLTSLPQTLELVVLVAWNVVGTAIYLNEKLLHELSSAVLLSISTVCGSSTVSRAILKRGAVFLTYGKSR